jgi:hypothetical protein
MTECSGGCGEPAPLAAGWMCGPCREGARIMNQNAIERAGGVLQKWAAKLPFMQQAVLLAAVRGPDGVDRSHKSKWLVKYYRRCLLYSAFDSMQAGRPVAILDPHHPGGGSFTGPLPDGWTLEGAVKAYIDARDELPAHYQGHMMHAVEVMGYKHSSLSVRAEWYDVYLRLAKGLHLNPETEEQMDFRLGDKKDQWKSVQVETYQGK